MGSVGSTLLGGQPVCTQETAIELLDKIFNEVDCRQKKSGFMKPEELVNQLVPGDVVQQKGNFFSKHLFYSHFAVYIGNGEIVHVTVDSSLSSKGHVKCEPLVEVCKRALVRKANIFDKVLKPQATREIVKAARGKEGRSWNYNLFTNNCEHFANLCRYGQKLSLQALGIGDIVTGHITAQDFHCHVEKSVTERCDTFDKWMKSKVIRLVIDASPSARAIESG